MKFLVDVTFTFDRNQDTLNWTIFNTMCGIFVSVMKGSKSKLSRSVQDEMQLLVHNRGPDKCSRCSAKFLDWNLAFFGSVLWMQGKTPVIQPTRDEKDNILLWNGDIFDGPWVAGDGESDTSVVLKNIFGNNSTEESILQSISTIVGPYSFVYWCASTKKLYFGRDRVGRHSLLYYFDADNQFVLTSVGKRGTPFMEVPVVGIFVLNFTEKSYTLTVCPWSDVTEKELLVQNLQIPTKVSELIVDSPICTKCPGPHDPPTEYNRILNEAFLKTNYLFDKLLSNTDTYTRVKCLLECLRKSVQIRCKTQPKMCKNCMVSIEGSFDKHKIKCSHPKLGILFSGGLDSTIIAALAHEYVPLEEPIDLFNVSFESSKNTTIQSSPQFNTPDRITGIQSSEELARLYPSRQWNFIQIDVSKEELNSIRTRRIGDLIHPLSSVLDDSLGCALWFASRLFGTLNDTKYISPARILFLGMGADEQFGGYMRHRNILRREGWAALAQEIDVELQRIASRNLGRDDRIVSDHGCQARFPFLDENVINFVSSLPVWTRCYPISELPLGFGDKLILRLVAWNLGLKKAAIIPKRAFQFGSRIANSKEKASDVSTRLKPELHQ